jgi:hypothetical protein
MAIRGLGGMSLINSSSLSDDIDIAIDNMVGEDFARHVQDYIEKENANATSDDAADDGSRKIVCSRSVGVIRQNPDQSKHLKTAVLSVMGMSIDFNNLRSEEYTKVRNDDDDDFLVFSYPDSSYWNRSRGRFKKRLYYQCSFLSLNDKNRSK